MAAKQTPVGDNKVTTSNTEDADTQIPDSARTNGEIDGTSVRTPTVGVTETSSFDERTGVTYPFMHSDGTQDNGAVDLEAQEGARRETTREGDNSTVEDTKTAIEHGDLPASDQRDETEDEPVKNPVA